APSLRELHLQASWGGRARPPPTISTPPAEAPMARPDDDTDDRRALGDLVAAYARGVDRRRPADVAALFCDDGVLAIYDGDPDRVAPTRERNGRAEIATALERLEMYTVTTHFLGQQYVDVDGERATGETYCLAHHLS